MFVGTFETGKSWEGAACHPSVKWSRGEEWFDLPTARCYQAERQDAPRPMPKVNNGWFIDGNKDVDAGSRRLIVAYDERRLFNSCLPPGMQSGEFSFSSSERKTCQLRAFARRAVQKYKLWAGEAIFSDWESSFCFGCADSLREKRGGTTAEDKWEWWVLE